MTDQQGASPPPSPPPPLPPDPPRRLTRSTTDRVVWGVAGGLGRYFDLDPVLFRIAFVVLTLAGGSGLLLYLAGWLLIPEDTSEESVGQRVTGGSDVMKVGVVVLAVLVSIPFFFFATHGFDGLIFPLLILGGALLWIDRDRRRKGGDRQQPPPPASPTSSTLTTPTTPGAPVPPTPPVPGSPPPEPEPAVDRGLSITKIVLSLLLIAAGVAALADQADLFDVEVAPFLAFALVVVGLGLIVGSRVGRSRGLISLGIVLTLILGVGAASDGVFDDGAGERSYRPLSAGDVQSEYRLGAGELTLDLTGFRYPNRPVETDVRVGAGEVLVLVPDDVAVTVRARAGAGDVDLFGHTEEGLSVDTTGQRTGERGELELDVRVTLGEITVREESR